MSLFIIALLQYLRARADDRPALWLCVKIAAWGLLPGRRALARASDACEGMTDAGYAAWRAIASPAAAGAHFAATACELEHRAHELGLQRRVITALTRTIDAARSAADRTVCDTRATRIMNERAALTAALNIVRLRAVQERAGKPPSSEFIAALKPELDTYAIECGLIKPAVETVTPETHPDVWAALQPPTTAR